MAAKFVGNKTHFKYCVVCKKVHIVGHWQVINEQIAAQLEKHYGKWNAEMTVCEDCGEKDEMDILLSVFADSKSET